MICKFSGPVFDRFHIHGKIANGGFATVFDAHDVLDDPRSAFVRRLALKVSLEVMGASPQTDRELRRFLSEADALRQLHCRRFPQIVQSGLCRGHAFIAMERVEGIGMHEYIRSYGSLHPIIACILVHKVCAAMLLAHQYGYIHRDLKPANIVVGPDGEITILDWNLVKSGRNHLTRRYEAYGTEGFASPEQRVSMRDVNERTDVYSAGKILLAAFTGLPVIGHIRLKANSNEVLHGGKRKRIRVPPSGALVSILGKMLARNPKDRWSMAEAERGLRAFLESQNASLRIPPPPSRLMRRASSALDPRLCRSLDAFVRNLKFI